MGFLRRGVERIASVRRGYFTWVTASRRRWVWVGGVLGWGGFMFVWMTALNLQSEGLKVVLIGAIFWPVGGYLFGALTWPLMRKRALRNTASTD